MWALAVLIAYLPVFFAVRRRGSASPRRLAAIFGFLLYVAAVVAATMFPVVLRPGGEHWADHHWWLVIRWIPGDVPLTDFILNMLMFAPIGLVLPLWWPALNPVRRLAALALALSCCIEGTQFVLWVTLGNYRMVDVNDLISNTTGAVLGLLVLRGLRADHEAVQARM